MLDLFINTIKKSKQVRSCLAVVFVSIFIFLSCLDSADPDRSDPGGIVNNFLREAFPQRGIANPSFGTDIVQIDTERLPRGTTIRVDQVLRSRDARITEFSVCLLDWISVINSEGRALIEFLPDYVETTTGQFHAFTLVTSITTPSGQRLARHFQIGLSGIAIIPPTDDEINIPGKGTPEEPSSLPLSFSTQGISPLTPEVTFSLRDDSLGTIDATILTTAVDTRTTVGDDGTFDAIYIPSDAKGTQIIKAKIELTIPDYIRNSFKYIQNSCSLVVRESIAIEASVMVDQVAAESAE